MRECPSQLNKIAYYVIHLFIIYFYFIYIQKCSKKLGKSGKIGLTWGQWHQLHLFPLAIQFGYRVFRYCAAIAAPIRRDSRGKSVYLTYRELCHLVQYTCRTVLAFKFHPPEHTPTNTNKHTRIYILLLPWGCEAILLHLKYQGDNN